MTETVIRKAEMTDLHQVLDLYRLLCDQQAGDPYTPEWVFGLHPDEEMLADHVRRQELWIAENGQQLQAAMALVPEGGAGGSWDCICWGSSSQPGVRDWPSG